MKYTNPDCIKFVKDMEKAGFEVEHYQGRFFWQGPAVRVDADSSFDHRSYHFNQAERVGELQDVYGATKVRLQKDNMGLGWIVYPVASDKGVA